MPRQKVATIHVYRDHTASNAAVYEDNWSTHFTVDVETPFGTQEVSVTAETTYSEPTKSMAGGVARFERVVRESVIECVKKFRANMIRERNHKNKKE